MTGKLAGPRVLLPVERLSTEVCSFRYEATVGADNTDVEGNNSSWAFLAESMRYLKVSLRACRLDHQEKMNHLAPA